MKFMRVAGMAVAGMMAFCSSSAFAEDTVAVMKLDVLGEGVDQQASLMLESLRTAVMGNSSLILDANGGDLTYTEMQMVTGCDRDASIACYDAACETLGAPAIIFGSVKAGGETHLVWYVSGKGIFREARGVVTTPETAERLAKDLVIGEVGSVIVTSNVPGADVFIDGKRVGMSAEFEENAQPIELVAGNYVISVRKDGYNKEDAQKITVEGGKVSKYHVDMTVAQDPEAIARAVKIAGYVSGGVGIASLIAGAVLEGVMASKNDDLNGLIRDADPSDLKSKNSSGKNMEYAKMGMWIAGGVLTAAGVSLLLTGFLYDFAGEDVEANVYMPKVDFNVTGDYQGVNLGWKF